MNDEEEDWFCRFRYKVLDEKNMLESLSLHDWQHTP